MQMSESVIINISHFYVFFRISFNFKQWYITFTAAVVVFISIRGQVIIDFSRLGLFPLLYCENFLVNFVIYMSNAEVKEPAVWQTESKNSKQALCGSEESKREFLSIVGHQDTALFAFVNLTCLSILGILSLQRLYKLLQVFMRCFVARFCRDINGEF